VAITCDHWEEVKEAGQQGAMLLAIHQHKVWALLSLHRSGSPVLGEQISSIGSAKLPLALHRKRRRKVKIQTAVTWFRLASQKDFVHCTFILCDHYCYTPV